MEAESGRGSSHLKAALFDESWRFDFFQAVRLLQMYAPDRKPVGTGDDPSAEAIRFHGRVSLSFPPSEVHEIRIPGIDGEAADMVVNFLGLASPASYGSLPMPYTELILDLERDKSHALRVFLDHFNHRLISMFYRAWEKNRFAVEYERAGSSRRGLFEQTLFSVMGIGSTGLQGGLEFNDRALLARAYAVSGRGISALGLSTLI